MKVEVHEEAEAEVDAAFEWYLEASREVASRFLAEVDRCLGRIEQTPLQAPAYLEGTRRYFLQRFPYSLVYRVRSDDVLVIALAHNRRRPGYWKDR